MIRRVLIGAEWVSGQCQYLVDQRPTVGGGDLLFGCNGRGEAGVGFVQAGLGQLERDGGAGGRSSEVGGASRAPAGWVFGIKDSSRVDSNGGAGARPSTPCRLRSASPPRFAPESWAIQNLVSLFSEAKKRRTFRQRVCAASSDQIKAAPEIEARRQWLISVDSKSHE